MATATLKEIEEKLFHSHDSFLDVDGAKCKLVAIYPKVHRPESRHYTVQQNNPDCFHVALRLIREDKQFDSIIHKDAVFEITPTK